MQHHELEHAKDFSRSKLYMWRTVISIAHADGKVCDEERHYLENIFELMQQRTGLTFRQHNILMNDLDFEQDALDMLAEVDDPKYRGQILHFAQLLAAKDGVICEKEQKLIDHLHAEISRDMEIDTVCKTERERLNSILAQEDYVTHGGLVSLIEKFLLSTGLKD